MVPRSPGAVHAILMIESSKPAVTAAVATIAAPILKLLLVQFNLSTSWADLIPCVKWALIGGLPSLNWKEVPVWWTLLPIAMQANPSPVIQLRAVSVFLLVLNSNQWLKTSLNQAVVNKSGLLPSSSTIFQSTADIITYNTCYIWHFHLIEMLGI